MARLGGDEFVIICHHITNADAALKISNQLLAGLTQPMNLLGTTAQMGASIGIALLPQHECIASDILTAADHAMYCAKRRGKGQVVLADETNTWNMVSTIQNKK